MPCWTVQTSTLKLQNADEELLKETLKQLGFTNIHLNAYGAKLTADRFSDGVSVKLMADGTVEVTASSRAAGTLGKVGSEVAMTYSQQVVQSVAQKQGWQLSWSKNAEGRPVAAVQRRGN